MSENEPSFQDLIDGLIDSIASTKLVKILKEKFQAQSFYEFFNRIIGVGLLLSILGVLIIGVLIILELVNNSILDIIPALFWIPIVLVVWFMLSMIGIINEGDDPVFGISEPHKISEYLRIFFGFLIIVLLFDRVYLKQGIGESVLITILGTLLIGTWLLGIAWVLGGLTGLYRLYRSNQ